MTSDTVLELLNDLGSSPEDVAKRLLVEDCPGEPFCPRSCPVAVYLLRHGFRFVQVGWAAVVWLDEQENWRVVETPEPVAAFLLEYDKGHYPELRRNRYGFEEKLSAVSTPDAS
jgi:hypothetical protein